MSNPRSSKGITRKAVSFRLPDNTDSETSVAASSVYTEPEVQAQDTSSSVPVLTSHNSEIGLDGTANPSAKGPVAKSGYASATSASKNRIRRNEDTSKTPGTSSIHRKTRLPWLDGNQPRNLQPRKVPGAFVDDDIVAGPVESWKYDVRTGADATMSPMPAAPMNSVDFGHAASPKPDVPARSPSRPLSTNAAQTVVERVLQAPVAYDFAHSKPAVPLVTLARQLHISDSTATNPDPNMLRRPRSFSESSTGTVRTPATIGMPRPLRSGRTSAMVNPAMNTTTRAGPEYQQSPSPMTATPTQLLDSRKHSLTVQPLRTDRLRTASDPDDGHRDRAMSVQPVRAKTWKELAPTKREDSYPPMPQRNPYESFYATERPGQPATANTLQSAVKGMENLLEDALHLARQAAANNNPDEVHGILKDASRAFGKAASPKSTKKQSFAFDEDSSETTSSSTISYDLDAGPPMVSVNQRGPRPASHGTRTPSFNHPPGPAAATQRNVRTVWDEDWPNHRVGVTHGPGSENSLDHGMNTHDWATGHPDQPRELQNSGKKPIAMQNTIQLPMQPPAAQPPARDQVNLVNRGITMRQPAAPSAVDGGPVVPPRKSSLATKRVATARALDTRNSPEPESPGHNEPGNIPMPARGSDGHNWGADKYDEKDYESYDDALKGKNHIVLKDGESFHWGYKPQPIARNWSLLRKRWTAFICCLNTALIGVLIGIYAGEVPAIQYALADRHHRVILGNVVLFLAIGLVVLICWPLPLLHGRRPYTLAGLAIALPLQIPQAVIVGTQRGTNYTGYIAGLLICRACTGIALGFVHINLISTLLDLFGSSLQSDNPHGETVVVDDVRRHGGGMGLWLGFWSWCWIGSLAIGFLIGAEVISGINISWGFYISTILVAIMLFLTVITPETRRRQHRRTMQEVELPNETISRRVARGEIKMHVSGDGPKWWWEEVFAGLYLSFRMLSQSGFLVMAIYVAWIYAEIVLIIVLLGNLLSANYRFRPEYVGLGVFGIAVGAWLAIPSSKANIFSKSRSRGPRTDSMTLKEPRFIWTSHFIRRTLFMTALPIAGLAYTLSSRGRSVQYMVPIVFAALIGYISNLAISECNGIIMETFDTSDLQPGANSRHRLQSLAPNIKRKRTSYSSYPRVSVGLFTTQALGYMLAAASTGVGGAVTRRVGAQRATAITAGILLLLTLLLTCALIRYKTVQVIPNALFGDNFGSNTANKSGNAAERKESNASQVSDRSWRAVVIGNPSGKLRRMNWMELGSLSRWTEVRRLNRMLNRSTTQGLTAGWS